MKRPAPQRANEPQIFASFTAAPANEAAGASHTLPEAPEPQALIVQSGGCNVCAG